MDNTKACSHDENRRKVCGPCGTKISFGKKKPNKFLINEKYETLIKKFINKDYDLNNEKYPLSICRTCYHTLFDASNNIFTRPFPDMPDYNSLVLPKSTRTSMDSCNCYVCLTGRYKGHEKVISKG